MKLLYPLIATLLFASSSIVNGQSCNQFLAALNDPSKCYQVSISGVHSQSLAQEGYKGNLRFIGDYGELVPMESLINLQTYETTCSNGLVQPFSAGDKFLIDDFSIRARDSNIRIKQVNAPLTCSQPDFANFKLNNFYYTVAIKAYDACPKLYYGEECDKGTVTVPPTTTAPPATATPKPTTAPPVGGNGIKYTLRIDSEWITNGVKFFQYGVLLTNNESTAIKSIQVNSNNWNPTEFWNIEKKSNGNYGFPSYVSILPIGDSFSFGFVSSEIAPVFQTISITRA